MIDLSTTLRGNLVIQFTAFWRKVRRVARRPTAGWSIMRIGRAREAWWNPPFDMLRL